MSAYSMKPTTDSRLPQRIPTNVHELFKRRLAIFWGQILSSLLVVVVTLTVLFLCLWIGEKRRTSIVLITEPTVAPAKSTVRTTRTTVRPTSEKIEPPTADTNRITKYIETELLANGPTVQWRGVSGENDIPLYNRPTDRLCDWVLGKLRLIWSNFCVKKIICSGRVEETTASVKLYSPSRIYRHLCPDMEDKGTREFALQQLNSPPEVSNRGSFKFIANNNNDIKVLYVKLTLSEAEKPTISSKSQSDSAKNEIIYQMDRILGWRKLNASIIRRCFDGVTDTNNGLQMAYFQIYLPEANNFQEVLLKEGLQFFSGFAPTVPEFVQQQNEGLLEMLMKFAFTLPEEIEIKDALVKDLVNAVLQRCTFMKTIVSAWTPVISGLSYEIRITLTLGNHVWGDLDAQCLTEAVQNELAAKWISQIEIIGQKSETAQRS
ncbi:hypothetical protein CRM22_011224 [Opisthorchis felineus]|uniref:Uncharacterized protein n=1 Tax=Opisthorchis felineus TaxID=147828 RepID=A0A4V3S8Q3_OPIFE|nr:hypothetical protein CRM22_011224 [Opisthorchis felineus]